MNYFHIQSTPSTSWTINHNMDTYPAIDVVLANGQKIMPKEILFTDSNQVRVTFEVAQSGKAILTGGMDKFVRNTSNDWTDRGFVEDVVN